MGVNCSNCAVAPKNGLPQEGGDAPGKPASGSVTPTFVVKAGEVGTFQPRSALKVKEGGFGAAAMIVQNRGAIADFYNIDEGTVLGEGTYSLVNKCTKKQGVPGATKQAFAVKTIQRRHMRRPNQFDNEFTLMRLLDHPNVLRMIESFEDEEALYLITELCEGGELFDNIVDRGPAPERSAAIILSQLLRAINYLHTNNIIHRDVKAENFFLAEDALPEKTTIKLGDFGLAKTFAPGDFCTTKAGTPYYVAPEILEGRYTNKTDVWAVGVIFYMLLGGAPPFTGLNTQDVFDKVKLAQVNVKRLGRPIADDCRDLLCGMICKDYEARWTAEAALRCAWMSRTMQPFEFGAKRGSALRSTVKAGNYGGNAQQIGTTLKNYSQASGIEKAVLNAIASQLSREALADLEQAFLQMDLNNDGTLNISEFMEGMKRSGVVIEINDAVTIFNGIDSDGSGCIDYSEFVAAMMDSTRAGKEDACYKAFQLFDLDGNGTIERKELKKLLQNDEVAGAFGSHELEELFADVEESNTGRPPGQEDEPKVSFEEFMALMNKLDRSGGAFPSVEVVTASLRATKRAGQSPRGGGSSARGSARSPRGSARGDSSRSPRQSGRQSGKNADSSRDGGKESGRGRVSGRGKDASARTSKSPGKEGKPDKS